MLGITMEESGVSKIIALRLDEDIKIGARLDKDNESFVEEDVPPEENAYIPPRPPKRIYNPDGTITDPELERIKKEEEELKKPQKQLRPLQPKKWQQKQKIMKPNSRIP